MALRVLLLELGGALDAARGVALQRIGWAGVSNRLKVLLALLGAASFDFEGGCVDAHFCSLLAYCRLRRVSNNY